MVATLYAATVAVPNIPASRPDDEFTTSKAHHKKGGLFQNPWESFRDMSAPEIVSTMYRRRWSGKSNVADTAASSVSVREPEFLPTRETKKLRATWLGHACFYVEFPGGLRVLFDPVFTDRCSPLSFIGPKRYTPPPCQIEDLPFIDAVFISHNHYDHLSHPTVLAVQKHHPQAHFFVPLGNKKWFLDSRIPNVTELDWWDEIDLTLTPSANNEKNSARQTSVTTASTNSTTTTTPQSPHSSAIKARISCLPSQHVSSRSPFDRLQALWASWSITSGPTNTSVYFAGDTGYRTLPSPYSKTTPPALRSTILSLPPEKSPAYSDYTKEFSHLPICPAFKQIGLHRGPFTLGLIPIGAYSPRWLWSPMHADPRDSVRIFQDTKCKKALGMHWGTWVMTEEDVMEPVRKLGQALGEVGLCEKVEGNEEGEVFGVVGAGESREVDD